MTIFPNPNRPTPHRLESPAGEPPFAPAKRGNLVGIIKPQPAPIPRRLGTCATCAHWRGWHVPDYFYFGGRLGQCRGPAGSMAPKHQYPHESCHHWAPCPERPGG